MSGSVEKRARLDVVPFTLTKDVWGVVLEKIFPDLESVASLLLALQLRGEERESVLKTGLRRYFTRDIGGNNVALLFFRVWLCFERAQMTMLTVAETVRYFPLSKRDISRMAGEKQSQLSIEEVLLMVLHLNRNLESKCQAISDMVAQRARIYCAARASLRHNCIDESLLWRSEYVATQLRKSLCARTRDNNATDAAVQVASLLQSMENAASPFSLKFLSIDGVAFLNRRFSGRGEEKKTALFDDLRSARAEAVEYVAKERRRKMGER